MEAVHVAVAHLRLAGVLGRRSWCEWYPWVRKPIAIPFWVLVGTGEDRVAAGEPEVSGGAFTASTATASSSAAVHLSGCHSS